MGFLADLFTLAKETPDERRQREREGRVITRHKAKQPAAPTSHPDDHYGFSGMDKWSQKRSQSPRGRK
jgi:hypothetical protein